MPRPAGRGWPGRGRRAHGGRVFTAKEAAGGLDDVARIRAAEGRPECLATAPRTTCALADGATSAGAIYLLRASALRPQADGVTGAGFALTVEVLARSTDRPNNGKSRPFPPRLSPS